MKNAFLDLGGEISAIRGEHMEISKQIGGERKWRKSLSEEGRGGNFLLLKLELSRG